MENKRYRDGEYVVVPVKNEFNSGMSYWMSRQGFMYAQYMFTARTQSDVTRFEAELERNMKEYEKLFDSVKISHKEQEKKIEQSIEWLKHQFGMDDAEWAAAHER